MKKLIIGILSAILVALGGGSIYTANLLGWGSGGDSAYTIRNVQATTSVSVGMRSIYYKQPTSTDPSVPTAGTHNSWIFSTTTYEGTPDTIPNSTDNKGFEYCINVDNVGQAIRFWVVNATGTDKNFSVGKDSGGFLLTAGNCWDSREFGIIYGGPVYTIASTTTSTVQYTIFK